MSTESSLTSYFLDNRLVYFTSTEHRQTYHNFGFKLWTHQHTLYENLHGTKAMIQDVFFKQYKLITTDEHKSAILVTTSSFDKIK